MQYLVIDKKERFWEIDLFRGIAIIMMIIFHIFFDLDFFNIYKQNLYSGFFLIFGFHEIITQDGNNLQKVVSNKRVRICAKATYTSDSMTRGSLEN